MVQDTLFELTELKTRGYAQPEPRDESETADDAVEDMQAEAA
jgi:hypothetical protein